LFLAPGTIGGSRTFLRGSSGTNSSGCVLTASVAYLCKMAPMAKFKCAPFLMISILIQAQFLRKINQENKCFETENMHFLFIKPFQQIKYKLSIRTITAFCTHLCKQGFFKVV